jgi:hypothetical protein
MDIATNLLNMNKLFLKTIVFLFLIGIATKTIAQEKTIKRGNQQWLQYYTQMKLSDKWILLADAGYRMANNFRNSSQYLVRAGINYTLSPNIQVGAGFAHFATFSEGKINRDEFRPYEELGIKSKLGNIDINNRVRIEERFFNPVVDGHIKGPGAFNFRFRDALTVNIPLFNLSKTDKDKKILLSIGDEIFLNAGKHIVYNVFDQNRFVISPTIQFSKDLSVSFTYNRQFAATNVAATYNQTNVIWLQLRQKFDLTHKK